MTVKFLKKKAFQEFKSLLKKAFNEDRVKEDITTQVLGAKIVTAEIFAKERCILCGIEFVKFAFLNRDKKLKVSVLKKDGKLLKKGDVILKIKGDLRSILSVERTALNFLSFLSGIATRTFEFKRKIASLWGKNSPQLLDTRKTIPCYRYLSKYAVKVAGAENHRFDLSQIPMVKDNHFKGFGRRKILEVFEGKKAIIEVDSVKDARQILKIKPLVLLCDNFSPANLKKVVKMKDLISPATLIEISGGINERTIKKYRNIKIDRISAGFLTHSVKSIDFSLEVV